VQTEQFDVVIVGGGLVGVTLALALADHHLKIAIVEANPVETISPHNNRSRSAGTADDRALALSLASSRIFQTLNLWPSIAPHATAIKQVHVSYAGQFAKTRFLASDYHIAAFGHVVPAGTLLYELRQAALKKTAIKWFCPAKLQQVTATADGYEIVIKAADSQQVLNARLLVAADGSDSETRRLLGISIKTHSYPDYAVVTTVNLEHGHHNIAYERFTKQGPIAALPLSDNRCAFVWTIPVTQVDYLKNLDAKAFYQQLQNAFGYRLGRLQGEGVRYMSPLRSMKATEQIRPGAVLLGNSAHTLHPVAAQGLNLGLRDAAALAQLIIAANAAGQNPGAMEVLEQYMVWREKEQKGVMSFTDGLIKLFAYDIPPVSLLINLGLCGLDMMPSAKPYPLVYCTASGSAANLGSVVLSSAAKSSVFS